MMNMFIYSLKLPRNLRDINRIKVDKYCSGMQLVSGGVYQW